MLYLDENHIKKIGVNWRRNIEVISNSVKCLWSGEFSQPIKPYVKFPNSKNRIIAMPAYIGDKLNVAGIKWIASFPENIHHGLKRANSITVLNNAENGMPFGLINTSLISGIRTAAVSGLILMEFDKIRFLEKAEVGIIGYGPIGQLHLQMIASVLGERLYKIKIFDTNGVRPELIPEELRNKVNIVDQWEVAYDESDVFVTCTVSSQGYIHREPKAGALILNVSLRDFKPEILDYTQSIIVDNWEEVCRENTDIEKMHIFRGLKKENTKSIIDVICNDGMKHFPTRQAIIFNPMGMAVFDISIAFEYYTLARQQGVGVQLNEEVKEIDEVSHAESNITSYSI
ncbi:2,3-diaminopropionate biosynthesis protein SbnB [Paenibacillus kribbensis]|uniref:2,3-diaminopropionate biosynthesis protein SbnB n=1 Tax=Paenibacillus kribbensis TaxID=172713 RepID=UPI0015BF24FA|nr:2,3-diaminopropionate biosynthesis protein SbnB [Paenibacillus kribbensis]